MRIEEGITIINNRNHSRINTHKDGVGLDLVPKFNTLNELRI